MNIVKKRTVSPCGIPWMYYTSLISLYLPGLMYGGIACQCNSPKMTKTTEIEDLQSVSLVMLTVMKKKCICILHIFAKFNGHTVDFFPNGESKWMINKFHTTKSMLFTCLYFTLSLPYLLTIQTGLLYLQHIDTHITRGILCMQSHSRRK